MIRKITAGMLALMMLCAGAFAEVVPQNPALTGGMNVLTEAEFVEPTAEELVVGAMEIYSWFTISPLDVDVELSDESGTLWRVADETLCDWEYVQTLLYQNFSAEVVADMLSYEIYTVIDGMLYTVPGGRGMDLNIDWVEYKDTFCTEEINVIEVTVHYLGEAELGVEADVFEFVREKIDGVWVFTQFPFFW